MNEEIEIDGIKFPKAKSEEIIINGRTFIKTTPSEGYELVKVGTEEHYAEAIDLPTSNFEYYEVALPPQVEEEQYEEVADN
jgi:hypothetical protein